MVAVRSKLIVGATAVILTLIVVGIVQALTSYGNGILDLTVSPTDVSVKVDGGVVTTKPGKLSLAPGQHTLEISRKGYVTQKVTVAVIAGTTQTKGVIMAPSGDQSSKDAEALTDKQKAAAEGVAGQIITQEGAKITAANPLIALLPYSGSDFLIDAGTSQAHPNDREAVAIYVTYAGTAAKTHATDWIKAQGYNPAAYEIIYQQPEE